LFKNTTAKPMSVICPKISFYGIWTT